jgi:hypothetical protein
MGNPSLCAGRAQRADRVMGLAVGASQATCSGTRRALPGFQDRERSPPPLTAAPFSCPSRTWVECCNRVRRLSRICLERDTWGFESAAAVWIGYGWARCSSQQLLLASRASILCHCVQDQTTIHRPGPCNDLPLASSIRFATVYKPTVAYIPSSLISPIPN